MKIDFQVTEEFDGKKVYQLLRGPMKLSGHLIGLLKTSDGILVNGRPARTIDIVEAGDIVSAVMEFHEKSYMKAENIPLSIIYEDDLILAVNKSPHMTVHTSAGHQTGTLAQGVLWHFEKQGLSVKIRPVNRLDRDTSGIVLFAKNAYVQHRLICQMKENGIYKEYLGIVHGCFNPLTGTIRLPIARKEGSILERTVDKSGDDSITHYETVHVYGDLSLVKFVLETGRTHQIRVHAKAMGHPVLGDWLYSDIPTVLIDRQALHSYKISFSHPLTGEKIDLTAPLPEDMKKVLASL